MAGGCSGRRRGAPPGEGVVEDEHVDARRAHLQLALDVLLVGVAPGRGNEDLGGQAEKENHQRLKGPRGSSGKTLIGGGLRPREAEPWLRAELRRAGLRSAPGVRS